MNCHFAKEDTKMVNIHMERKMLNIISQEMQSKTMRNHYTPSRMAKIEKLIIPSYGQDIKELKLSYVVSGNVNGIQSITSGNSW